jgi:hypothetical protein
MGCAHTAGDLAALTGAISAVAGCLGTDQLHAAFRKTLEQLLRTQAASGAKSWCGSTVACG